MEMSKPKKVRVRNHEVFFQLTKRNFLVFTRNKMRMFFTLMVPIIILIIYILFLRSLELSSIREAINSIEGIPPIDDKTLMVFMDSWFLSGNVALCSISISLQTNNLIINDKENGINRDFASAPIHKTVVTFAYMFFNFLITLLLCFCFVCVTFIFLAAMNEFYLNALDVLIIFGVLAFITLNASAFTTLVCSFIDTDATLASVIAVVSACLGFLIGSFMPLSLMPKLMQDIVFFIPGTHATALMRYAYLKSPLEILGNQFNPTQLSILKNQVGYNLIFYIRDMMTSVDLSVDPILQGGAVITPDIQAYITTGFTCGFMGLNFLSRKNTVKTYIK
ncbi:MAG: ABC transporter permease [Bacilli bacterium]|nr:ABC transporter permease [Bacilli bacterium]